MTSTDTRTDNQQFDTTNIVHGIKEFGGVVKEHGERIVKAAGREYAEINKKHPGFGQVAAKVALIFGAALSFLLRPFSTAIGFGVGLIFAKDVKSLLNKIDEWFKTANPFMKGVAIVGAAVGLIFTPVLGGLATGAYCGQKVAEKISERQKAEVE
jgi:phage-related minor tail protein